MAFTDQQQCVCRRDAKCNKVSKVIVSDGSGCRLASVGSCRRMLYKRLNSMCAERMEMKPKCTHDWARILVSLLAVFLVLQFAQSATSGHLLPAARIECRRISYFLGKTWRQIIGISQSNYTYPGLVPPYVPDPLCSKSVSLSSEKPSGSPDSKSMDIEGGPEFDICLPVSIGDDGGQPREGALPYQLMYSRLFGAMRDEIDLARGSGKEKGSGKRNSKEVIKILVGVDYKSIVCKMLRDFLEELPGGVEAQCRNFDQLVQGTKCGRVIAGSTQLFVTQVSPHFTQVVKWTSQRLVDLDCSIPAEDVPSISKKDWRPTVVTGFSSNHMAVGLLMLRSLGKAAKEGAKDLGANGISLVVYAMEVFKPQHQAILDCVIDELNNEYNVRAEVRLFDFESHPKWMRVNQSRGYFGGTGEYAWKAIMVHTVLRERGIAVWADAGDRFTDTPALVETLKTLKSTGFVSRKSHGTIWTRTHPLHLKFFRADLPGIWDLENCEAAIVGFTLKKYKEVARPWYECSLIRQCIAPDGSDRSNHRQDQAALSVLSVLSKTPCEGAHQHFGHHMDDNPIDSERVFTLGVYTTHCYVDPLRLDLPQGTYLDQGREGPYVWH